MILREQLDQAAFWGEWICLDCGEVCEGEEDPGLASCPDCGGEMVFAAGLVKILERIEE